MSTERKGWLNTTTLVPMIPTTVLAIAAIFWLFQGIATQEDLTLIRNDVQEDLTLIRNDLNSMRDEFNRRLDKLDSNFEYIRDKMVTKSDIQQLQVDVAQNKQNHVDHLTYQHSSSKP